jgi:ADP-heptose:LPS heptosyltransferase
VAARDAALGHESCNVCCIRTGTFQAVHLSPEHLQKLQRSLVSHSDIFSENTHCPPLLQRMQPAKLVVFRALQLGDMLCAVPALRALRAALPHSHITLVGLPWAAQFAQRFSNYIDDFAAFPGHPDFPEQPVQEQQVPAFYRQMRERRFDLALQLHGSGEISNQIVCAFGAAVVAGFAAADNTPAGLTVSMPYPKSGAEPARLLALTSCIGAPPQAAHLEFPLADADRQELAAFSVVGGLQRGRYLCFHPGARNRAKCWPAENFARVADALALESGLPVVLTGSEKEIDLADAVAARMQTPALNAAGPISIGAMAALIGGARLLVCNDTGVSHIAAGLRLPSVVIFSSADMQRWAPLDSTRHRCVRDPEGTQTAAVLAHARELLAPALVEK